MALWWEWFGRGGGAYGNCKKIRDIGNEFGAVGVEGWLLVVGGWLVVVGAVDFRLPEFEGVLS